MIFQSLGSNYSFNDILQALFGLGGKKTVHALEQTLAESFGGSVISIYKGREALAVGLGQISVKGKRMRVAIIGLTCYAVYQAIEAAGAEAVYIDVAKNSLNFTIEQLKKTYKKYPDVSAVIVQNTLGVPAPIFKIAEFCKKHDIILIEDLAHSLGAFYNSDNLAGTVGDMTVCSFGRDKIIDAVSGGGLIIRNEKLMSGKERITETDIKRSIAVRDRVYPLLSLLVRQNYDIGLGKLFHKSFTKLGFMQKATDISGAKPYHRIPGWNARMANNGIKNVHTDIKHRLEIAKIYAERLPVRMLVADMIDTMEHGTCLRFPILVDDRMGLIEDLRRYGVHISDTWYDSPVAPPRHLAKTNYKAGTCPNAEYLAEHLVNLPTHRGVSSAMARLICTRIENWQSK